MNSIDGACWSHWPAAVPDPAPVAAPGHVVWITGLSGAGKTTVARLLVAELRLGGAAVVHLDGDTLREVYGDDAGHGVEDRRRIAMRHARLCRLLSGQGLDVVCSTISMFAACRQWNRAQILRYTEVYLRVPFDELARRDPKGLYGTRTEPPAVSMVGRDLAFEEPESADLVIDNHGAAVPADAVRSILRQIRSTATVRP